MGARFLLVLAKEHPSSPFLFVSLNIFYTFSWCNPIFPSSTEKRFSVQGTLTKGKNAKYNKPPTN
jgi:hypothetical protein